jgi:hypothetical protein
VQMLKYRANISKFNRSLQAACDFGYHHAFWFPW